MPETIKHYILECRNYEDSRRTLVTNLRREGVVEITVKVLLGGGNYNRDTQDRISTALKRSSREQKDVWHHVNTQERHNRRSCRILI